MREISGAFAYLEIRHHDASIFCMHDMHHDFDIYTVSPVEIVPAHAATSGIPAECTSEISRGMGVHAQQLSRGRAGTGATREVDGSVDQRHKTAQTLYTAHCLQTSSQRRKSQIIDT